VSHFSVGVIVNKKFNANELEDAVTETVDKYSEHLEVSPYIRQYKTDLINELLAEKEEIKNLFILLDSDEARFDELYPNYNKTYIRNYWENKKDKSEIELYEERVKNSDLDDEGNVLSTYNPDSKWDYWSIGGRWDGLLAVRNKKGKIEHSNYARLKDIIYPETLYFCNDLENREKTIKHYETDKDLREHIDQDYNSLDEYLAEIEKMRPLTYAMVINGEWIEPGKMGWWAMTDETDASRNLYQEKVLKYFEDNKDSENWLVIIDCHI
jgi:hypothetical protein